MIDLQECRNEIDKIDSDIIRLFEQRMKVCEDVAEYKIRTGKKVLDPERERQKLEVLRGKAHGEFNQLGAQELFQQIMAISRKRRNCTLQLLFSVPYFLWKPNRPRMRTLSLRSGIFSLPVPEISSQLLMIQGLSSSENYSLQKLMRIWNQLHICL